MDDQSISRYNKKAQSRTQEYQHLTSTNPW